MPCSNEHVKMETVEQFVLAAVTSLPNDDNGPSYNEIFANLEETSFKKRNITQKVRQENRERKKRWRQQNQEKNQDNDLRCRVNKRAHRLFGAEDGPHKQKWIDQEFIKRRDKRMNKEEQKDSKDGLLNDSNDYLSMLSKQDKSEQFTSQLLEFLHQQTDFPLEEPVIQEETTVKPVDYPMDAVLTLMQLNAGWRQ